MTNYMYAQELMPGSVRTTETINDAMKWGSICEDHAVATYIHGMSCQKFEKTGLWITKDKECSPWLAVSPDGIVNDNMYSGRNKVPLYGRNSLPI